MIAWILARLTPILLALLVGVSAFAGLQTLRFHQKTTELAEFRAATVEVSRAREAEYTRNLLSVRKSEQALIDLADQARKEKHEAVQKLDRRVADLTERLRIERAPRPAAIASGTDAPPAGPAASGTGAGLYFPDAAFLVGEAATSYQLGIERDECRALYNAARQTLNQELLP